jgi:dTDP-4-dehydrorhamnose reductase
MKPTEFKLAITGASGALGTALLACLSKQAQVFATSRTMGFLAPGITWDCFDLLDKSKLVAWLLAVKPKVVIHCAALVNVDACEHDEQGAYALHVETTATIVETIAAWGGRLIYISTDCVFDGLRDTPYSEQDEVNPGSVYAKTKWAGEQMTLNYPKGLVLRTNIIGWSRAERCSFAEWVLKGLVEKTRLTMFTDVHFTPIYMMHVAEILSQLIEQDLNGLFHLGGSTALSKFDFAMKLAQAFDLSADNIVPIRLEDAKLVAKRPKNMMMTSQALADVMACAIPTIDQGILYFKEHYDSGWLARVKGRTVAQGYCFWREA